MDYLKEIQATEWDASYSNEIQYQALKAIEHGKIVLLPELAFTLKPEEKKFLSPDYADPKAKNISFNHTIGKLRCGKCSAEDHQHLTLLLQRFSNDAQQLVHALLSPYTRSLELGRTSFRPVEVLGRVSSYRKDDTRLHVDAFPATPNQGRRILRVFSNVNPDGQDRVWRVGEPFDLVINRFLPKARKQWLGEASLLKMLSITKSYRTEYDHLMLQIHDAMKADKDYQTIASQEEIRFAPGASWIVQTDHVSHAAMSGQYLFEQTFYLPVDAMIEPQLSPLRTLEKKLGRKLV